METSKRSNNLHSLRLVKRIKGFVTRKQKRELVYVSSKASNLKIKSMSLFDLLGIPLLTVHERHNFVRETTEKLGYYL